MTAMLSCCCAAPDALRVPAGRLHLPALGASLEERRPVWLVSAGVFWGGGAGPGCGLGGDQEIGRLAASSKGQGAGVWQRHQQARRMAWQPAVKRPSSSGGPSPPP